MSQMDKSSHYCRICFEDYQTTNTDIEVDDHDAERDVETGLKAVSLDLPSSDNLEDAIKTNCQPFYLSCGHSFCMECLHKHMESSVEDKKIPFTCPATACDITFTEDIITALMEPLILANQGSMWRIKYERLQHMNENPALVECTKCDHLVDSSTASDGGSNDLTCPACLHCFCKVHGDSHPNTTCAAFMESKRGKQLEQSEAALRKYTKECTRCGAKLQKSNGCDYVVCGNCRGDFCYRCGTHEHFVTKNNMRSCTRCKFTREPVGPYNPPNCCKLTLVWLGVILLYLLLLILWPVIFILLLLFGSCLYKSHVQDKPWTRKEKFFVVIYVWFFPLCLLVDGFLVWVLNRRPYIEDNLPFHKAPEIPYLETMETTSESASEL